MSKLSRTKGAAYERKVALMLSEATGMTWRRRVRNHDGDSDVVCDDAALAHISIECKHADRLCLPAWWRQAQDQAGERGIPVLIYRQTGARGDTVVIDAHHASTSHWPVAGRHTVSMGWEAAMQWLREHIPQKTISGPGYI
ncbi:putative PDDEXK endonuclease [Bordetella avium]|uniref:putative PDDEXK endonuclease n=1 Tax=Bordetella avium TaxID=521 RepID=UPI0021751EFC|nr:hypothetical protein [Bordetella avium]